MKLYRSKGKTRTYHLDRKGGNRREGERENERPTGRFKHFQFIVKHEVLSLTVAMAGFPLGSILLPCECIHATSLVIAL